MRAVVQRVARAGVAVNEKMVGKIDGGLCILLGVGVGDAEGDAEWLADKIVNLRIFEDDDGKMNRSLLERGGGVLVVSQFTLYGDCRKGRRPSFVEAASPEEGKRLYEYFVERVRGRGIEAECGIFQTHMMVEIVNDGPVTLILDTRKA
ncbi:MAG: D-tyrosyl-tRNA(Tyr) deacylase [Synergistaceae bacterium]|jgi:D-tyrosyl-tRNA(Tyr) deacylase|nr:D-tyrosyl-tRNA(Tyr) deacylase [Synergistaceae bacterium]